MLVDQPRTAPANVQRLENAIAAQGAEIVGAEDRCFRWDHATAEYGHSPAGECAPGRGG
jgi:hypothetical protein